MILKDPKCCLENEPIFLVTLNYDPPQFTDEISGRLLTYCSKCIEGNSNVSLAIPVEEVDQETLIMLYEGGYTGSSPAGFMELFCYPDERLTQKLMEIWERSRELWQFKQKYRRYDQGRLRRNEQ